MDMLGIYPYQPSSERQATLVRCPVCSKGRICDKLPKTVIRLSVDSDAQMHQSDDAIILKCPRCRMQIVLELRND